MTSYSQSIGGSSEIKFKVLLWNDNFITLCMRVKKYKLDAQNANCYRHFPQISHEILLVSIDFLFSI